MRRKLLIAVVAATVVAAGCTASGGGSTAASTVSASTSASPQPVTVTVWAYWSGRELREFTAMFDRLHQLEPWITVQVSGGVNDTKILAAINSGQPPDVAVSSDMNQIPNLCSSGAWQDLKPYVVYGVDMGQFPPSAAEFTQYQGVRCAMPFTADSYGLYYNTDMFKKAGITSPPKTWSEMTADVKKLTVFNPDGSIKVAGFVPWMGYYETNAVTLGVPAGTSWYDAKGKSTLATDPRWKALLEWQKSLIDFYGADNLQRFIAGAGNEFSSAQDLQTGRVAMNLDGEWRVAFIEDGNPDLNYATAPFPVPDDAAETYGIGQIGLGIIGVPRGAEHPDAAWDVVKYLATDTKNLVYLGNVVKNIPTTLAALKSPDLNTPPQFQAFLDMYANPASTYKGTTLIGSEDIDIFQRFLERWQTGQVTDLQGGLEQAAKEIDDAVAQASGP
jgi:multiple sugar transport system substrate-binding protein